MDQLRALRHVDMGETTCRSLKWASECEGKVIVSLRNCWFAGTFPHKHLSGLQKTVQKQENIQWAAVLWVYQMYVQVLYQNGDIFHSEIELLRSTNVHGLFYKNAWFIFD